MASRDYHSEGCTEYGRESYLNRKVTQNGKAEQDLL